VLGSSWKLGGAAEHLIDASEKRICGLSFEFKSPHFIERGSKSVRGKGQTLSDSESISTPEFEHYVHCPEFASLYPMFFYLQNSDKRTLSRS